MLRGNLHEALGQPKLAAQSFAKAEHAIEIPFYISDRTFLKSVRSQYGAPRMLSEARKLAENGKSYESVHRLRESLKHDYIEMPIRNLIRMQMEIGSTDDAIKTIDEFIEHAGHTSHRSRIARRHPMVTAGSGWSTTVVGARVENASKRVLAPKSWSVVRIATE